MAAGSSSPIRRCRLRQKSHNAEEAGVTDARADIKRPRQAGIATPGPLTAACRP